MDVVESDIMSVVDDDDLEIAGAVLLNVKTRLIELIGSEAEGAGDIEL